MSISLPLLPIFIFALLVATSESNALSLSSKYQYAPISRSSDAQLFHTVDTVGSTASFAVVINDSNIVTNSSNCISVAVSEPTGGLMLASDIVTAEFSPASTSMCTSTHRYVPFYAYPLDESIADALSNFPIPDHCQHDASCTLLARQRNQTHPQMIWEVVPPFGAHDEQDWPIVPRLTNFIYAYGPAFAYHDSRRRSIRVYLHGDGNKSKSRTENPLPDHVHGSSDKITTYACTSNKITVEMGQKLMLMAAEPVVSSSLVHHLTLWLCSSENYANVTSRSVECSTGGSDIPDLQRAGFAQCSTFIHGYAKGMRRLVLPREAGILLDDDNHILVMEALYDNANLLSSTKHFSGVRVFYTNSMTEHEASSLLMGDIVLSRMGQAVKNRFKYGHTCTSACTNNFSLPIHYYSSMLHIHTTGRQIHSDKFGANGTFIQNVNKVDFWSGNFQNYFSSDPAKQIVPEEQLQLSCVFDTIKTPKTVFGLASSNERCMEFTGHWPVQRDPITNQKINICAFYEHPGSKIQGTLCNHIASLNAASVLPGPNPALEDAVGADTSFATALRTCEVTQSVVPSASPLVVPSLVVEQIPLPRDEAAETSDGQMISSPDSDVDNACFPASATVQLRDGSRKHMHELRIGDSVLVGANEFSEVFMFTHRCAHVRYPFVELSTKSGAAISLTRGHFLYVNGVLKTAARVRNGDKVMLDTGEEDEVTRTWMVTKEGLYNAHTLHGNIVVDGVVASTYTHTVVPEMAHSLLVPLRVFHQCVQLLCSIWCGASLARLSIAW